MIPPLWSLMKKSMKLAQIGLNLFVLISAVTTSRAIAGDLQWNLDQPQTDPTFISDAPADENTADISPEILADIIASPRAASTQTASPDVVSTDRPTTQLTPLAAATQPETSSAANGNFASVGGAFGLQEFANHFAPYEPMYFVGGWQSPNVKFQFSFRYRILTPTGPLATEYPWLKGFNFAYSQTSLWDFEGQSSPFFYDSSYRPEVFYLLENIPRLKLPPGWQLGFQTGVGHESNGKGGTDERSLNTAYFRPIITLSDSKSQWFISFSPKFYGYILSLSHNPDIARYRGYDDLRLVIGERDGLQLAAEGNIGNKFDRGDIQLDLTYPLTKLFHGNTDLSIDLQYFDGYGDTLIDYNHRRSIFRLGFNLLR